MLCTSFIHRKEECCLKNLGKATPKCRVKESNKAFGQEYHHTLHLSKNNHYVASTLLTSATPTPSYTEHAANQEYLIKSAAHKKSSASLFVVQKMPVKAMGGARSDLALMMDDNGTTENFITHALAKKLTLPQLRYSTHQYKESASIKTHMNTCLRWWMLKELVILSRP